MDRKRLMTDTALFGTPERHSPKLSRVEFDSISNIRLNTTNIRDSYVSSSENVPRIKSKLDENVGINNDTVYKIKDSSCLTKTHTSTLYKQESDSTTGANSHNTINTNICNTHMRYSEKVPMIKSELDKNAVNSDNIRNESNMSASSSNNTCRSNDYILNSPSFISYEKMLFNSVPDTNLRHGLIKWAVQYKISQVALISLLKILKQHCICTSLSRAQIIKIPQKQEIAPELINNQQCDQTFVTKNIHYRNNDNDNNESPLSTSLNLNKKDLQCKNLANIEEEDSDNEHKIKRLDFEQKSDNFQCYVMQKLISLEILLNRFENNMNSYQKAIFQKHGILDIEVENFDDSIFFDNLPLKDDDDLKIMEAILKNDSGYRNQLIKQLVRITSKNLRTSCLRLIRTLLSNELAVKYSWCGARGRKRVFSQLEICKLIMSVIRQTRLHKNATNDEIADPIRIWLASAKSRIEKKNQNETEAS